MLGLIGKKVGMTQVYDSAGEMIPVTVVDAGPCYVTQVKTTKKDGYNAVQVGYGDKKKKHINRPMEGHFKKASVEPKKILAEFEAIPDFQYKQGQMFSVALFKEGEFVSVRGTSKGKGFAGVIKRHNFSMQPKTHGTKNTLRHPGSIGQASDPSRVFRGMKMAGHMGNANVTVPSIEIIKIIKEKNQILLKGAIPGARNGIVYILK